MTCPAPRWLWDGFLPAWPCLQPLPTRTGVSHGPCLLPEGGQRLIFKTLLLRSGPCAHGTALTTAGAPLLLQALLCAGVKAEQGRPGQGRPRQGFCLRAGGRPEPRAAGVLRARVPEVAGAGRGQGAAPRATCQRWGLPACRGSGAGASLCTVSLCPLFPQIYPIASVRFSCVWC